MLTLRQRRLAGPMGLSLMIACGALALGAPPAGAHSQASCKVGALYACKDMQGQHEICVAYATQLCAGHDHIIAHPYRTPGGLSANPGRNGGVLTRSRLSPSRPAGMFSPGRGTGGPSIRFGGIGRLGR